MPRVRPRRSRAGPWAGAAEAPTARCWSCLRAPRRPHGWPPAPREPRRPLTRAWGRPRAPQALPPGRHPRGMHVQAEVQPRAPPSPAPCDPPAEARAAPSSPGAPHLRRPTGTAGARRLCAAAGGRAQASTQQPVAATPLLVGSRVVQRRPAAPGPRPQQPLRLLRCSRRRQGRSPPARAPLQTGRLPLARWAPQQGAGPRPAPCATQGRGRGHRGLPGRRPRQNR